jgi:hypothetical protein
MTSSKNTKYIVEREKKNSHKFTANVHASSSPSFVMAHSRRTLSLARASLAASALGRSHTDSRICGDRETARGKQVSGNTIKDIQ